MSQSRLYSSLKYLSKTYVVGKCHPVVKPCLNSDRDIPRIPVKNKALTGTYILQTNRVKFNQNEVNPVCQRCKEDDETLHSTSLLTVNLWKRLDNQFSRTLYGYSMT